MVRYGMVWYDLVVRCGCVCSMHRASVGVVGREGVREEKEGAWCFGRITDHEVLE